MQWWRENTCWEIGEVRVLPFLKPSPVTEKRKITFQGCCRTLQKIHVVLVRNCMWTQLQGRTAPRVLEGGKFPLLDGGKMPSSLALKGSAALVSFLGLLSPNWTAAMTIPDTWHWILGLCLSINLWPLMPISQPCVQIIASIFHSGEGDLGGC